jgi:biopolymer transport protein ExbB/TolQ
VTEFWEAIPLVWTSVISSLALFAVWLPFQRGVRVCVQARNATRSLKTAELRSIDQPRGDAIDPVAALLLRVLRSSLRDNKGAQPKEFLVDASRQFALHEYESHYSQLISMYANILPPIGFIGTTGGLMILFVSMRASSDTLELGALAVALVSTIFALIGFATLEGFKIHLYRRLMGSLDGALGVQREAEVRATAARASQ